MNMLNTGVSSLSSHVEIFLWNSILLAHRTNSISPFDLKDIIFFSRTNYDDFDHRNNMRSVVTFPKIPVNISKNWCIYTTTHSFQELKHSSEIYNYMNFMQLEKNVLSLDYKRYLD